MLDPIEEYLPKAVLKETDFLRSRQKTHNHMQDSSQQVSIVPTSLMFSDGETIVVKIHATPYLRKTFLTKETDLPERTCFNRKNKYIFFHQHDFFEFNYVYQGSVQNCLESEKLVQTHQQIILMNPYAVHAIETLEENTILFNILIDRSWMEQVFVNLLSFHKGFFNFFLDSVYGLNRLTPYLVMENMPELTSIFHKMIAEYYRERTYYQQVLFSKLIELFAVLSRQQAESNQKMSLEFLQQRNIGAILNYLKMNYNHISLADTAKFFNYTPNYLSKLVKRYTGKHFSEILQEYKLESACNYLIYSSLSIEKINEIIGYNDASYFSKLFHKKYGISPHQYRIKYRVDRLKNL